MSRIHRPLRVFTSTPAVRKIVAGDLVAFVGANIGALALARQLHGTDIELDPRSSDFGKVRLGDTRIDIHGGDASFYRLIARLSVAAYSKLREGKTEVPVTQVAGKRVADPGEEIIRYSTSRDAPWIGNAKELLTRREWLGQV